jgi:hypothetical protein
VGVTYLGESLADRNQIGDVSVKLGKRLVECGEAGGVRTGEMSQVRIGHLAVADDPGYRDVVV